MAKNKMMIIVLLTVFFLAATGCKKKEVDPPSDIDKRSCDTMNGVLTQDRVSVDETAFCEGKGSLKISADTLMTLPLYEISYPGIENADLVFKAKLKTQDLAGSARLRMAVHFPNGGEVPALQDPKTAPGGTTDWTEVSATIPIPPGQKPSKVSLDIMIESMGGTLWVDDIRLTQVPK